MHWFMIALAIISNVIANIALKVAMQNAALDTSVPMIVAVVKQPMFWIGMVAAGTLLCSYLLAIRELHIGIAYALVTGLALVLMTLSSVLIFDNRLGIQQLLGIGLILLGVFLVTVKFGVDSLLK